MASFVSQVGNYRPVYQAIVNGLRSMKTAAQFPAQRILSKGPPGTPDVNVFFDETQLDVLEVTVRSVLRSEPFINCPLISPLSKFDVKAYSETLPHSGASLFRPGFRQLKIYLEPKETFYDPRNKMEEKIEIVEEAEGIVKVYADRKVFDCFKVSICSVNVENLTL